MPIATSSLIRPIILSGGSGTRLWPLSTPARPKQFLPLTGERSLLGETFARLSDDALFSAPTVICGTGHVEQVQVIATSLGIPTPRIDINWRIGWRRVACGRRPTSKWW